MRRRQFIPAQWRIISDPSEIRAASRMKQDRGLLLLAAPPAKEMRRLRVLARQRHLTLIQEGPRTARRVHNSKELRQALLARTPLILLSPLFRTASHPDWTPIPRMRAAALARLGGRRLLALGGMNDERYASVASLGFLGWAGISAWLK